ncbi:MFS transporter [Prescottella agglutinans]|uniref:MFS family arabinose efflux permease n=1 Tax=Prescottella agglutinans TaxID=1644129 RepID=A0ABT6MJ52_9NOCA|nr:MFS transporter [Prescottella agglutinans]MDH6284353.1 putative MFS family arabinose efflux permease [Prescottella agglutinans]
MRDSTPTPTTDTPLTDEAAGEPKFSWLPVIAIALCTFTVVTSEMMPVGLLTPMSTGLGVTEGVTGLSVMITGLIGAVASPLAPMLIGLRDRKKVLAAFMVLLAIANALTAFAPNFAVLAVARVVLGISMGVVWGLAAGVGARLADERRVARAMTIVFSGVSLASVLGVPLGAYVATLWGWRSAFISLTLLGLAATVLLLATLPPLPVFERSTFHGTFGMLRNRGVAAGMAITAIAVVGHFAGYTYVRPLLETGPAMTSGLIVLALAVYGAAGVIGNFTLGSLAGRYPKTVVVGILSGIAIATAALPLAVTSVAATLAGLLLWGVSYGSLSVSTQAWIRIADPARVETTAALWSGVFNASIAVGAVAGGVIIETASVDAVMRTAALLSVAAVVVAATSRPQGRTSDIS